MSGTVPMAAPQLPTPPACFAVAWLEVEGPFAGMWLWEAYEVGPGLAAPRHLASGSFSTVSWRHPAWASRSLIQRGVSAVTGINPAAVAVLKEGAHA